MVYIPLQRVTKTRCSYIYIHMHSLTSLLASWEEATDPHCTTLNEHSQWLYCSPTEELVYPFYVNSDPFPFLHLTWSKLLIRPDAVELHIETIKAALWLPSIQHSCTSILPCSTDIPLASKSLFTLSTHPIRGLPLNHTSLTSDLIIFSNCFSSIIATYQNYHNITSLT